MKITKFTLYYKFIFFILLCCIGQRCFAVNAEDIAKSKGVFDTIVNNFAILIQPLAEQYLKVAKYIFWTISFLEFTYQIAFKKMFANDFSKIWIFAMTRMLLTTAMFHFALDLETYKGVINWLVNLGNINSVGTIKSSGNVANFIDFSPSALWSKEWEIFGKLITVLLIAAAGGGILSTATGVFLFQLGGGLFMIMLSTVIITMWIIVQTYFVLFVGCFLAGFSGSSWTMNYWQKYLSFMAGAGVKLMTVSIVIGFMNTQMNSPTWITDDVGATTSLLTNFLSTIGVFLFDLALLFGLPRLADSLLSGTISAGLGDVVGAASSVMSGGKMLSSPIAGATKATKGLVSSAAKSSSGGAKSAAFKAMRNELKNGVGAGGSTSDANFREAVKQKGKDAANSVSGITSAKKDLSDGFRKGKDAAQNFANKASSGGGSSGSHLNIDPHK
jgi:type IV secretory pathway TrbL component